MRNTRERIVELLKKKVAFQHRRREIETDQWIRDRELHVAIAYQEAIWLLTDEKYFKKIEDCYREE